MWKKNDNKKIRNVKRMKIRRMKKKLLKKKCLINYLGTVSANFQLGLAKIDPYAYQPILTHKIKLISLSVDYSNKLIPGGFRKFEKS